MSTEPALGHIGQRWSRSPHPLSPTSNYAVGICLLLVAMFLWTISNFLTQHVFADGYHKPFLMTYLTTAAFNLYLFPSCLRASFGSTQSQRRNINYYIPQDISTERDALFSRPPREISARLTPGETAKLAMQLCFLWFGSNLSLNASLAYTSVASATILTSMGGILTLLVGRLLHVETLSLSKIAAVLTSFAGVVLVSHSDSSSTGTATGSDANSYPINLIAIFGDVLALLSALLYALYTVLLKVRIKEESQTDMQLFFGYAGFFVASLCWPVALLLHWLGVESWEFPRTRHVVVAILLNMFIMLLIEYTYAIAMLKTTPLVATVGISLTIPFAVIGDYLLGTPAAFQVLAGAVLVMSGFVAVGVENSKSGREESGGEESDEGMGQQAQRRLDETVPTSES